MAGNLTGMFAQLNQGIMRNPLVTGAGESLINSGIKGFGGALGAATGQDKYGFMNEGARKLQGKEDLGSVDLQTAVGLTQAADIYGKMGETDNQMAASAAARANSWLTRSWQRSRSYVSPSLSRQRTTASHRTLSR